MVSKVYRKICEEFFSISLDLGYPGLDGQPGMDGR